MSNTTEFDHEVMDDALYIPLVVLGTLSSTLSILGSASIVFMAKRDFKKQLMHRLLFCMSLADLGVSIGLLMMPFAIPSFMGLPGAVGSHASCSASGFLLVSAAKLEVCYNTALSLYYFLVVRRNWKEHDFSKHLEVAGHVLALAAVLAIDVFALATQSINPTPGFNSLCLYAAWPWACEEGGAEECERSSYQIVTTLLFVVGPYFFVLSLAGFVLTGMVWCTVRRTLHRSNRHRFEHSINTTGMDASGRTSSASNDDPTSRRLREVGLQAVLYSMAYLNTFVWPMFTMIVYGTKGTEIVQTTRLEPGFYVLQLLFWTLCPLQV